MEERAEEQSNEQTAPEQDSGAAAPAAGSAAAGEAEEVLESSAEEVTEEPAETELEAALRERDEYLDLAQRARADLDNYRRRVSGEATAAEQRGRAAVARDLLGAIDNLERALLAAGVDPDGEIVEGEPVSKEVSAQAALAEGVALVYRELRESLRRGGVEAFDPVGERFDPALHDAIATGDGDGAEKGAVIEVLEKGYRIGEQVLRPARVVVSG